MATCGHANIHRRNSGDVSIAGSAGRISAAVSQARASAEDQEVRDGERAVDLARRTLRAGTNPSRLETLAMANAEAGLFDEAVRVQGRAIEMMIWEGRPDALPRLEANLARYLAGQTCCATR